MIILNDQLLTTRQFPHSSLLCADFLGTALSIHASTNNNTSKALTYIHKKGTICRACCKMLLYKNSMFGKKWKDSDLASTTRVNLKSYFTWRNCHLRASSWTQQPLSICSLKALPIFAWTSSGSSAFPRSRTCSVFRIHPAALGRGTGLRTGVGPRTRCCDGPQLLK